MVALVRRMWQANPTWGSPCIRAELAKLGIPLSDSTVQKYRPKPRRSPSAQTWETFLDNHVRDLVAIDFSTVPTAAFRMRLLYVFLVLAHERRQIPHFNLTEAPSALWTVQQMVEAFSYTTPPRDLLRDRDSISTRITCARFSPITWLIIITIGPTDPLIRIVRSPGQRNRQTRATSSNGRCWADCITVIAGKLPEAALLTLAGVGHQYAVKRDPWVRKHGGEILRALRIQQEVTGKPGLLARGYVKGHGPVEDWERNGQDSPKWYQGQGRLFRARVGRSLC